MPQPNALRLVVWITLSSSLLGALFAYAENRPYSIANFVNTELHGVVAGGLNGGILSSLEILVLRGAYGAPLRQLPFLPFSRYARFSIWASSCLCSSPTICGSASPAPTSPSRSL